MADEKSRFTSDRRTQGDASWSETGDWEAGTVENVDIVNGTLVSRPVSTTPTGIPDSVVNQRFIGNNSGSLHAVNASDGSGKWTYSTADSIHSSPAVVDGTVYIGSNDGSLYAVNTSDGSEEWTQSTGNAIYSSSPIGGADGWAFTNRPGAVGNTEPLQPWW